MAINGRAITPIMAKMVIMGVMARPIMAVSLTFMDVPGKYTQNVAVKTVSKIFILQNLWPKQKNVRKNGHFQAIFFVKLPES